MQTVPDDRAGIQRDSDIESLKSKQTQAARQLILSGFFICSYFDCFLF